MKNLKQLEEIVQKVRHLKKPEIEKTIFSIGGRGHYENPISDILAFFLDPKEQHGFGNLFLESLFQSVNKEVTSLRLADSPNREQPTKSGNRIDLIVEGDDWVMVIENKIRHSANNPFDDYEQYTREIYHGKKPIFVLLSIEKATHENWAPVTYASFITQIKANIGNYLSSANNNKWHVILREFILNIENEYGSIMYNKDRVDFAKKYYSEIKELNTILKEYLEYIRQKGTEAINRASNNQGAASASSPKGSSRDTVFDFYSTQWGNNANIALWVWADGGFRVQFYLHNVTDAQDAIIKKHFELDAMGYQHFERERNTTRCIGFFDSSNENSIFLEIEKLTEKLNSYFQSQTNEQVELEAIAEPA